MKRFARILASILSVVQPAFAGSNSASPAPPNPIVEFSFHTPKSGPSIVMSDPDGSVWVAMARVGKIGRFSQGELREFSLPEGAFPVGIAIGGPRSIWYSDVRRNCIGRLDPSDGSVKEHPVPTANAWPFFLIKDKQGILWFTERVGNKLGRLDPRTAEITEFPVPTPNCQPAGLAITPSDELYFTENSGNRIGHFDQKKNMVIEYPIPSPATPSPFYGPAGITSDQEGNIWFCELDGRLGRIRRGTTVIEEFPVPRKNARPAGIVVDKWGVAWFTQLDANSIACFDVTSGFYREYPIPTGKPDREPMGPPEVTARGEKPSPGPSARTSRPFGITCDGEGRIWFSEQYAHKVGMLTPPEINIVSPVGSISALNPEIKLLLRLSPSDRKRLSFVLDGHPIPFSRSLDLSQLSPGRHTFDVCVGNEQMPRATTEFIFNPTLETLLELAKHVIKTERITRAGNGEIVMQLQLANEKAKQGRTDLSREIIRNLIADLFVAPHQRGYSLLLSHLRYYDLFCQREYEVTATGSELNPAQMIVEVGDGVVWQNIADDTLILKTLDGTFNTVSVAPGQRFRHIFHHEGRFQISCTNGQTQRLGEVIVNSRTTSMVEFPMIGPGRVPTVMDLDHKGNLWFTAGGGGFSKLGDVPLNNKIGCLTPERVIHEYETPTMESAPTSIEVDKDGHVWFTERGGNNIGCLDPATGAIKEYPIPTPMAGATGIEIDHRTGKVWFTEKKASKLGALDPTTGQIVEYDTPSKESLPSTVAIDEEGFVWFDERSADNLVRLNPVTGEMKTYKVPTPRSRVVGITPDKKGHVYFVELGGHKVGKLEVQTGMITEYSIPTKFCTPFKLAVDYWGRVWFTEVFGNKIGVLNGDGNFVEFSLRTKDAMPGGILIDQNGNVWFTEQAANRIGMIPQAALFSASECKLADGYGAAQIAAKMERR